MFRNLIDNVTIIIGNYEKIERFKYTFLPNLEILLSPHLKRNIHAAKKVVLAPGSRALRDLLEESSQPFHAPHLVQFAHRVEHRGLVVMVPETMSVRATQTLATQGRDTDLHRNIPRGSSILVSIV